jgi:phosphohistidine swiveling domain-containing protein
MADHKLSKLLETQISLTEWLERVKHQDSAALRSEDNAKRERLGKISEITGLPYDKPTQFDAIDVAERSSAFKKFITTHGEELCALRLMPKKGLHLEKLRNRGKTIAGAVEWFDTLDINPEQYIADFVPHTEDYSWATIFVVNGHGVFGEIYLGGHHNLTQGLYEGDAPILFGYDFKNWVLQPENNDAQYYLQELIQHIHVANTQQRLKLARKLGVTFSRGYMKGYFESTHSQSVGTWFIDYNQTLGERYGDFIWPQQHPNTPRAIVRGRVAGTGSASGRVRVINDPQSEQINDSEILVCEMTTPDFIPHMMKARGIVTDKGGILCHAAIVARELGKPCIVGTGNATSVLKTGDDVHLNTLDGTVSYGH